MKINSQIFRNYDIRGIVGEDLDCSKVEAIGKAYGTFLQRRKIRQIVCGRDSRLSGLDFQLAFMEGVSSTGVDIVDLGEIMTQMMYFGQYRFQTNGGAMITASHNPSNYNGFKLGIGYSQSTGPDALQEMLRYIENDSFKTSSTKGVVTKVDIKEDYFADLLKRVQIKKSQKVVVDSHCGTTALFIPELLRRVGVEVIEMNTDVDGSFPMGTPDPTDSKLMDKLSSVVKEKSADIGMAFDGDGDRIGLVDEKGRILWNDVLIAIFAQEILGRFPGSKIIYNTLCSQVVSSVVSRNGGTPIMWKTGHAFIKSKMSEERAAFGGELSGHFFFADNAYGHDDGAYAALRILEYLSEKDVSLSTLYESFPMYKSSPEIKIGCPDDKKKEVIADLAAKFKGDFPDARITDADIIPGDDGVRADFEDGMIVFRYSQNGPYITIKFEARDSDTYESRKKYVKTLLLNYPEMIWKDSLCINLDELN